MKIFNSPLYTHVARIRNQPKSCGTPICLTIVSFRVEIPQGTYFISHIMAWLVSNKWHLFMNLSSQQCRYMAKPLPNDVHPIWTQMVGVCSVRRVYVCVPHWITEQISTLSHPHSPISASSVWTATPAPSSIHREFHPSNHYRPKYEVDMEMFQHICIWLEYTSLCWKSMGRVSVVIEDHVKVVFSLNGAWMLACGRVCVCASACTRRWIS